jgi:hypothetical protein
MCSVALWIRSRSRDHETTGTSEAGWREVLHAPAECARREPGFEPLLIRASFELVAKLEDIISKWHDHQPTTWPQDTQGFCNGCLQQLEATVEVLADAVQRIDQVCRVVREWQSFMRSGVVSAGPEISPAGLHRPALR